MRQYSEVISVRVSKEDKEKINLVLKEINKTSYENVGYRFLLMDFVNSFLDNNMSSLELEKARLIREYEKAKEDMVIADKAILEIENKIKEIDKKIKMGD